MPFHHFEADFNDGTTYIQGDDDQSIDTPDKNAFYDILQREDEVIKFHVVGDDGNRASVNLQDGTFEINGVPFVVHGQFEELPEKLKLVFWKETHQQFDVNMEFIRKYTNRVFLGWRSKTDNEKGVQHTIAVT